MCKLIKKKLEVLEQVEKLCHFKEFDVHVDEGQRMEEELTQEEVDNKEYGNFEDDEKHWSEYGDEIIEFPSKEGENMQDIPWGNSSYLFYYDDVVQFEDYSKSIKHESR